MGGGGVLSLSASSINQVSALSAYSTSAVEAQLRGRGGGGGAHVYKQGGGGGGPLGEGSAIQSRRPPPPPPGDAHDLETALTEIPNR